MHSNINLKKSGSKTIIWSKVWRNLLEWTNIVYRHPHIINWHLNLWRLKLFQSFRANIHHLIVLFNLSGKLFKDLFCQLNSIVPKLSKFHKLNKVSCSFSTFTINKLTVIIINLIHDIKRSITYSDNDDTNWQWTAFNYLIDDLLFVMNLSICKDKHYHVLVQLACLFFYFITLLYCWCKYYIEVSRTSEFEVLYCWTVCLHNSLNHKNMRIVLVPI